MAEVAMTILQSVSKELGKILVEEGKHLYAVSEKISKLQLDLEMMQSFLQDAASQQHDSQVIHSLVSQIRDFTYETQDVIEKYSMRVNNHHGGVCNLTKWLSCAKISGDVIRLHKIGSEIDGISQRMSDLTSRLQLCGVQGIPRDNLSTEIARMSELRRTDSHIGHDEVIVGLEEDADIVIHQLINMDTKVVAISGMGGLGKSTLAKKVCNHRSVKKHFENIVWVFLSQQFEAANILRVILRKIWVNDKEKRKELQDLGDEELPGKVRETLQQTRYLVVFDDIWTEKSWDRLRRALSLPCGSPSKLLLTTRNHELQEYVDDTGYLHILKSLDPQDSWNLLYTVASRGQYTIDSEMKDLGEKMLQHCKYLPLAIVTVGGILKSKNTRESWKVILNNIHSIMTATDCGNGLFEVLKLSYDELPCFLKPYFLYLACFPEDYEIETKKLYHLWAAEGLLIKSSPSSANRFEKVETLDHAGELCLEELVKRCMVQVEKRSDTGKITSFHMHDLMRDMCIQRASEENFFCIISGAEKCGSSTSTLSNNTVHRLTIHHERSNTATDRIIGRAKHLRSILLFSSKVSVMRCSAQSSMLRVLDLEGIYLSLLPKHIKNLVHLKYLSLKDTHLDKVPSFISKLTNLQTLDLRINMHNITGVPDVLWKMRMLIHLYLPQRLYTYGGWSCPWLRLHTLTSLETLENFDLSYCRIRDLLELKSIRRLTFSTYPVLGLSTLNFILTLPNIALGLHEEPSRISVQGKTLNKHFIDKIVQLPGFGHFVGSMIIHGKILPDLNSVKTCFRDLTTLIFVNCELKSDPMPLLGTLPKLSKLIFADRSFAGKKMICSTGLFTELTYLVLEILINLEEWVVEEGAMPKLKDVLILHCNKLNQLPDMLADRVEIKRPPSEPDTQYFGTSQLREDVIGSL